MQKRNCCHRCGSSQSGTTPTDREQGTHLPVGPEGPAVFGGDEGDEHQTPLQCHVDLILPVRPGLDVVLILTRGEEGGRGGGGQQHAVRKR